MMRYFKPEFSLLGAWFCTSAFAALYNYFSGGWMIGSGVISMLIACLIFSAIITGALCVVVAFRPSGNQTTAAPHAITGVAVGLCLYIANVVLGFNAGFTLKGLVVIALMGVVGGVGGLLGVDRRKKKLVEDVREANTALVSALRNRRTCCGATACATTTECEPANCGKCAGNRPCGGAYPKSACPRKANCEVVGEALILLRDNVPDRLPEMSKRELSTALSKYRAMLTKVAALPTDVD